MSERKLFWTSVAIAVMLFVALLSVPIRKMIQQRIKIANNRKAARTCVENLKEIYQAFKMYTEDWDGKFPLSLRTNRLLHGLDPEYVKNVNIFICPSDPNKGAEWDSEYPISYDYWFSVWLDPFSSLRRILPTEEFYKIISIKSPSTIRITDCGWHSGENAPAKSWRDKCLALFLDGSVRLAPQEYDGTFGRFKQIKNLLQGGEKR